MAVKLAMKVRPYLNLKKLSKLVPCNLFNDRIKKYIEYYGDDIFIICKKYYKILKIFIPLTIIIAILGVLKFKFLLLSVVPLALIAYLYPLLYAWSRTEEHKKVVNSEAPFIALLAYIDSLVDKGLNYTFKELSEIQELKVPKVEQNFLLKMTNYMNMPFSKAIEKRALVHNGDLLGKLYNNYLSALSLGITVRDRLKDALKDLLNDLKDSYKSYVEKSTELTELEFSLFLLLPIMLIGFSFTFKVSLTELFLPLLFVPPIIFLVSSIQPNVEYNIKYGKYLYTLVVIPVLLLIPNINLEYKILGSISVLLVLSYYIYSQITLANELEKSLPILLKEVSEYLKIGYTIQNAIPKVKLNSKRVNIILENFLRKPDSVSSPSKLFNVTFKLLFIIAKTGSSSISLEELANSISEIIYNKNNLIKQLKIFDVMAILTPIMLWLTFGMLGKISITTIPSVSIISAYSVASVLTFSKISRFTLLNFPLMLLMTIILAILSVLPPVFL